MRTRDKRERPILFSATMVLAILDGRKTQTRRIVKSNRGPPPTHIGASPLREPALAAAWWVEPGGWVHCPFGCPGDHLWVRETIERAALSFDGRDFAVYAADGAPTALDSWGWQRPVLPSIHCPRGLSRIDLEVTGARVERLQDISEEDALREGLGEGAWDEGWLDMVSDEFGEVNARCSTPREWFSELWDSINGDRAPWASNPWVWVVEFRRVRP